MRKDNSTQPSIALVYDRVAVEHGGAEDLLQVLHQAFPEAPLFTSVANFKLSWVKDWQLRPTFLQTIPHAHRFYRLLAPLMPIAFENFAFPDFDIVLSVSSAEAKGVITKPDQLHLCYLFTPTRHLYEYAEAYGTNSGWHKWPILKPAIFVFRQYLTWWDQQAAQRPDMFITLSQKCAKKIQQIYKRSSIVLYPPVVIDPNMTDQMVTKVVKTLDYALSLSRLVSYKKVKDCITACHSMKKNIIVVGSGPDFSQLSNLYRAQTQIRSSNQSIAKTLTLALQNNKSIIFVGDVSNAERTTLLLNSKVLLMLGDEDFGISAIQAAIQGIPTIVSAQSGASELLTNLPTSIQLSTTSNVEICSALKKVLKIGKTLTGTQDLAQKTSPEFFIRQIKEIVYDEWRKHMKKYDNSKKGV